MGAIVAAIGDRVRRPRRARQGDAGVDALEAVDRRVEERGQRLGPRQDAAEKMIGEGGAERPSSPLLSAKRFVLPRLSHSETCAWQPLPVRLLNGFGMKVARSPS